MKGNEALAEAAIQAGCRFYAGYPITPQNEIPEYLSRRLPAAAGHSFRRRARWRRSTWCTAHPPAGPRHDVVEQPRHKPETGRHIVPAGAELPAVIVNMQRGGPGLGNISASQADYFQAVKGGGHGTTGCSSMLPTTCRSCGTLQCSPSTRPMSTGPR